MIDRMQRLLGFNRPVERALVEAGRTEEPSAEAFKRTASALGIGGLAGTSFLPLAAASGKSTLSTWLLISGVSLGGAVGAAAMFYESSEPAPPATLQAHAPGAARRQTPAIPRASNAASDVASPAEGRAAQEAPAREAIVSRTATPRVNARQETAASQASSLGGEVRALDAARRALMAGGGANVLQRLRDYERAFPSGSLTQEARLLEVEALALLGRSAQARRLATSLLVRNPESAHRKRLESLLETL
ncbi:MAG TPA: hypothetical protein VF989_00265 [Polyangiaceae bacterium]|jgi:hypothetical protein